MPRKKSPPRRNPAIDARTTRTKTRVPARAVPAAPREGVPRPSRGDSPPSPLPKFVAPELATLVNGAPRGDEWLYEIKFDGYRALARLDRGRAELSSRTGRSWTSHFPAITAAVAKLPAEQALLDGEIAVFVDDGTSSFQALQQFLSGDRARQPSYVAFDLLHLDGRDLTAAGTEDRKTICKQLLDAAAQGEPLRYSDHVIGNGPEFLAHACRAGLEGVIAKRRDAPYRSGRGTDWLKIKCLREQEVVIGGYTEPEGTRIGLGALLAGVHEGGRLTYVGKVGTGFSNRTLRDLMKRLEPLAQAECAFAIRPTGVGRSHWVRPELVAQVAFGEWTADGKMRHPTFKGLREDKPAAEVVREVPAGVEGDAIAKPSKPARRPSAGEESAVAGVRLTNAQRVLYPSLGTTKRDLALFYESIAEWILPHLEDRPTALVRCPEGVDKPCFFQKHVGYWAPESVRRVKIREKTKVGQYLVVDSLAALIGLAQIDILEIHTWNSVVERLERPDRIVIDLDPDPAVPWVRVVEAAREVRERLLAAGLQSFVKTTGGKGLHVVTPLSPGSTWDDGARFAQALATRMVRDNPREYVAHMAKAARRGKIFIDYLRNVRGATSVAAYSTRAKPGAPVSVPLDWDELSADLHSDHYTVANLRSRLAALKRDPWVRYWTARQPLPKPERL